MWAMIQLIDRKQEQKTTKFSTQSTGIIIIIIYIIKRKE